MASIGWLHLTDLHEGESQDHKRLWSNVEQKFIEDLRRLKDRTDPWDAVFFTGDLTLRGSAADFEKLGETLEKLWGEFKRIGCDPALFAVPGNHDLVRPAAKPAVEILRKWYKHPDAQGTFWESKENEYRRVVDDAFQPFTTWYAGWRKRHPHPWYKSWQDGAIPGDFSATLEKDGLRIGLVGLNSAFLQLTDDNYERRLNMDVRQLNSVCANESGRWSEAHHTAILLTHHPATWLENKNEDHFYSEIAQPERFFVHLFGHMHVPAAEYIRTGGSRTVRTAQGASLFGIERYRGGKDKRIHGYSAGRLDVDLAGPAGCLKVWPRIVKFTQAGKAGYRLAPDWDNFELDVNDSFTEGIDVRRVEDTPAEKLFRACLDDATPQKLLDELQQCRKVAAATRMDEVTIARLRVEAGLLGASRGSEPWVAVEGLARDLGKDAAASPTIDAGYELVRSETRKRIAVYFSVLEEQLKLAPRLLCNVRVQDGFLAPLHLLTGLLTHFEDNWTPVLAAFGRSVTEGDPPVWRMLQSFIFDCWLLWGPSIPICSCKLWTTPSECGAALQYGYGDENNSIAVLVTLEQRDDIVRRVWGTSSQPGGAARGLARRVRIVAQLVAVGALEKARVPDAQASIMEGEKYDYVLEYRDVELPPAESKGDYYSAYVWVMFEVNDGMQQNAAGRPWLRLLPFFEHTNIADGSTYDFMREQLARKVLSFVERYGDEQTSFHYVCAFDDPGHGTDILIGFNRPTIKEKLAELLQSPEYEGIRKTVHLSGPQTLPACELPRLVTSFYENVSAAEQVQLETPRKLQKV